MVAHRGASAEEPENTLAAFERAVEAGADVVEFDVRMTADDVAVVLHDPTVDRTTPGTGAIRDLSLREARALGIPTLDEVLTLLSGRIAVDIEIKNIPGEPDFDAEREVAVEATLAALEATAFVGQVILSSFNPFSIARSLVLAPDVPTGLLTEPTTDPRAALRFAAEHGHSWILPFVERVVEAGPDLPQETHEAGLLLGTWITDDPATAVALMRGGVDAVATNDPVAILTARREAFGH
ncbi:MAG TPA: glycerophosphodiester phosphodiesterase [Actinomycetota bacterium]|nr:glycerophosphodiester phosphodiesterase [Actinomycetota bacterium]